MRTCRVQLLLSVQGTMSMPGMVFTTVVSKQLDKGVIWLMCACSVYACKHPEVAEFPPAVFHVLPRGLQ